MPSRAVAPSGQSCVFQRESHPGSETEKTSRSLAFAPTERPRPLIEPAILRRHLPRPGEAVAHRTDRDHDKRINDIIMQGDQRALEQRVVDEAHRPGEKGEIKDALPV